MNSGNHEVERILCNIIRMQKEAVREEIQDEMCTGKLGECGVYRAARFNTRPLELFTINDEPWHCPIFREDVDCNVADERPRQSCVFRVEKCEGDTATFRTLIKEYKDGHERYLPTDSFITIKVASISAIRCLKDTFCNLCIH